MMPNDNITGGGTTIAYRSVRASAREMTVGYITYWCHVCARITSVRAHAQGRVWPVITHWCFGCERQTEHTWD